MNNWKEEFITSAWHEAKCPAHTNQMGREDECNCLYSMVSEDFIPEIIEKLIEDVIQNGKQNMWLSGMGADVVKQQLRDKWL